MISKEMYELGSKKSTIRTIFEYGIERAKVVGAENVYDFSLGNPNVPTPEIVTKTMIDILQNEDPCDIHGYTVAPGNPECRKLIAESINRRFGTNFEGKNIFFTAGAAASITICFKALSEKDDEFIAFAPFFPEYKCFVESTGAQLKVVPADTEKFQINFEEFEKILNKNTKAVIVNSPNNPSGAVYNEDTIKKLADILRDKEKEYGHPIFIISDEPYREIAYDDVNVPYITKYYDNTLVCYSYSKSLSFPGERIGYIVIPDELPDYNVIFASIAGAARVLTHVNAPALFQKVVARCADVPSNVEAYKLNRDLLYNGLIEAGFECVKPDGAFYLFPKALEEDEKAFCEKAKKYDLLLVPGSDFGCPGYFRASYCINTETIRKSIPVFKKLVEEYR
ncbi:pyridoxal phosphate-dependent aminotransferase [Clostridium sp. SM-530-WT-3G]|uniref:pyridoxal phosphate-dependent aminotransferase n=1 Tax=Clostridium sp. SM-530-WT-3G TaxID=2725303 RepID=UPI00145EB931|nr:pyridoxal phosphate-dependent aminotransferase [Clostridium sp. SM-530-WT-3G]NME83353.1 pyridoxal phosphate-dependent aminotransferase [Clostridium sp. SM-530-WT-3G]